jgi:predicted kinase
MIKTLHIMRGVSGSGKSTATNKLIANVTRNMAYSSNNFSVHSTDTVIEREFGGKEGYSDFFQELNSTGDYGKLGVVHRQNQKEAHESMKNGVRHVIIDNTNLTRREFKPYLKSAEEFEYHVVIHNVEYKPLTAEQLAERNTHNVPLEVIEKMIEKFDRDPQMKVLS